MTALKPPTTTAADCDMEKAREWADFLTGKSDMFRGVACPLNRDNNANLARCFQAQAEALEAVARDPDAGHLGEATWQLVAELTGRK